MCMVREPTLRLQKGKKPQKTKRKKTPKKEASKQKTRGGQSLEGR